MNPLAPPLFKSKWHGRSSVHVLVIQKLHKNTLPNIQHVTASSTALDPLENVENYATSSYMAARATSLKSGYRKYLACKTSNIVEQQCSQENIAITEPPSNPVRTVVHICELIKGHRATAHRKITLEELVPLTTQVGTSFVNAWLDIITYHAFLWKHGGTHCDPSLWNVMFHPTRECGTLVDFDLSPLARLPHVPGTNRAGTIPFMSLDLLFDENWEGKITRRYHHELEAFIWMLPFVFLAYRNGKFDPKNNFIRHWITSDPIACAKEKSFFITNKLSDAVSSVGSAFEDYQELILDACVMVRKQHNKRKEQVEKLFRQKILGKRGEISLLCGAYSSLFFFVRVSIPPDSKSTSPFSIVLEPKMYSNFGELKAVFDSP